MGNAAFDVTGPALATRLIQRFAGATGTATLTRKTQASYDPLTGADTFDPEVVTTVDVSPPEKVSEELVTDTIKSTDMVSYIAKSEYTFADNDLHQVKLTYVGTVLDLVWFNPIYAGANIAAYQTFWRKL